MFCIQLLHSLLERKKEKERKKERKGLGCWEIKETGQYVFFLDVELVIL